MLIVYMEFYSVLISFTVKIVFGNLKSVVK